MVEVTTGQKLAQMVLDNGITKRTDYSGEYIYQNDTLQFINHEEGRIVMTGDVPEYQYHLKDHLGNVRVTFTTKQDIEENTATLETANDATEQSQFLYYDEAVKINSTLFDHTNNGATQYSTRLSGSPNELTGLAKSISVMPGDTIRTEVYAKYLDGNTSNWTTALTNFMAAIAGGTAPEGTFVDGGATGSTGGTTPSFIGLLDKGDETGNAPKAYLNYLIFDKNYVLLNGGFVRMSENAREYGQDGAHEKLAAEFVITEPGYVYIYLSNDNAALGGSMTEVYFDDFSISQSKSPILEENFYYPFGMIAQRNSREGMTEQSYLYNGFEIQDELDLGWYDYIARQYDPAIGRFTSVDPAADLMRRISPYAYAFNNPIRFIDPDGMVPEDTTDPKAKVQVSSTVSSAKLDDGTSIIHEVTTTTTTTTTEVINDDGSRVVNDDIVKIVNTNTTTLNESGEVIDNIVSNEISSKTRETIIDSDGNVTGSSETAEQVLFPKSYLGDQTFVGPKTEALIVIAQEDYKTQNGVWWKREPLNTVMRMFGNQRVTDPAGPTPQQHSRNGVRYRPDGNYTREDSMRMYGEHYNGKPLKDRSRFEKKNK